MKALKITGCSDSMMWYRNHIGKIVPLLQKGVNDHLSREPAGYTNMVLAKDCEVIDVQSVNDVLYAKPYDNRYE